MFLPKSAAKRKEPTELQKIFLQLKRAFYYALAFSLALNILQLLLPIYSLQVLDRVLSSHSLDTLVVLTFIVVVGFVFYGAFNMIRTYVMQSMNDWLDAKLAPKLLEISIIKASLGAQANANQYQRDLLSIKTFIAGGAPVMMDLPWSIIFILVIYMVSPVLGFLTVIGAVLLLVAAIINEYTTRTALERGQENAIQSALIVDTASRNAEAIEAMGMMKNVLRNWSRENDKSLVLQNLAANRGNVVQSITRSVRMVIQVAVIGIGAYLALINELTAGGMIASSILVARALAPFEGAIAVWKNWIGAQDAYRRLEQLVGAPIKLRGEMALPRPQGRLTVESAYFQPPGVPAILKNINFVLEPGESLGIIGPSAAGKSTLAKLIIGILPTSHGSVRLDGAETFKWNREELGPYVGYMPQQVDLFNGTIRDNIGRMGEDISDEEVIAAAKFAGCHDMILRLPQGYETEFQQGNLSLSPGQRQRIGLARALYGRPQFLVLDEPNGNLDGEGERALLQALTHMKQAKMNFIVVAHRPSIVGSVDKILMLRGGVVEAFGPREEVLKQFVPQARPAQAGPTQAAKTGDAA